MKKPILSIALMVGLAAGAVTIPRASIRQIAASPLGRGETAYVENEAPGEEYFETANRRGTKAAKTGTAYAEVYIGGESGPLRVCDSSALRGYKLRKLDSSEYSVSAGPLFTHDVASGTYTMTSAGPTNAIIVTARDGVVIEEVTIKTAFTGEGLIPGEFTCSANTYDGSVYRWECAFARAASMIVQDITVKAMDKGEVKWVNDTIDTVFMVHDLLGTYNLNDLRRWARDLYNGNRGENWSAYKAYKPVRLDGQAIRFTEDNRFTMSISAASNLVLQAAKRDAVEINIRTNGEPIAYTTFRITQISVASGVVLDFSCDISGFASANIGVECCDGLEDGVWLGLAASDFVVSNVSTSGGVTTGTVTVPAGVRGNKRFFRLMYGAAASDTIDIALHGRVIVKDVLILKGTDSKFYQINVTGGTISATEVTL